MLEISKTCKISQGIAKYKLSLQGISESRWNGRGKFGPQDENIFCGNEDKLMEKRW